MTADDASFARAHFPMSFHGIRIIESPLLPFERAKRGMVSKPWHSRLGTGGYADRVRKKWRKRYGTELVEMVMLPDMCAMSSDAIRRLKEASR